jgi:hypothetical protein
MTVVASIAVGLVNPPTTNEFQGTSLCIYLVDQPTNTWIVWQGNFDAIPGQSSTSYTTDLDAPQHGTIFSYSIVTTDVNGLTWDANGIYGNVVGEIDVTGTFPALAALMNMAYHADSVFNGVSGWAHLIPDYSYVLSHGGFQHNSNGFFFSNFASVDGSTQQVENTLTFVTGNFTYDGNGIPISGTPTGVGQWSNIHNGWLLYNQFYDTHLGGQVLDNTVTNVLDGLFNDKMRSDFFGAGHHDRHAELCRNCGQ